MQFSKRRQRRPADNDTAILPLTNVVFLLLIFFVLAGRLTAPQPFDIDPPRSQSEARADPEGIEIQIAADGSLALDGEAIDSDALAAQVAARLERTPNTPVRLKADGAGDATRVVAVMHALHDAGVDKLRLITLAPQP